jgi:hypothetical protein
VIGFLKEQYAADPLKRPITLDCTWYVNPGLNFYVTTDSLQWLRLMEYHKDANLNSPSRYYYTMGDEREAFKKDWRPIVNFKNSDRTLFVRKSDSLFAGEETVELP